MNEEKKEIISRKIVVPGELLVKGQMKPGVGTYARDGQIFAATVGILNIHGNYVNVIPLSGKYIPRVGDVVIGKIIDVAPTNWLVDINAPYPAPLHITGTPWRIEMGETQKYLDIGDMVLCEVEAVDETKRVMVTMARPGCKKLTSGEIIEITPTKVPRVIGKGGSMINLLKNYTRCRIFVGQNGRIWLEGNVEMIALAILAIRKIEEESHLLGLTEAIKNFLEERTKTGTKSEGQ
ncbi:MAG: exosome complex RNA-binding protein Rrp4 [Thermoplasmata archaeon]